MISVCRVSIDFQMLLPVPPSRQSESLMLITNRNWLYEGIYSWALWTESRRENFKSDNRGDENNLYSNNSHQQKKFCKTTGDPSSRCEMIILRNNRHGEIIRALWEYLRPLYGIKKSVKFSQKIPHLTSTVRWLLSDRLLRGREPISASNVAT